LTGPDPAGSTTDADEGSYAVSPAPAPPVRGNSFLGSMLMNPSYTGAILEKMSTQLADFFGVSSGTGLLVRSVVPNSPASDAGMRAGDVVVRANSRPVVSTNDWAKLIKSSHGQALSVVVIRDKKEQTLTLIPDAKKRSDLESAPSASDVLVAGLGIS
jgi:serine protease Do